MKYASLSLLKKGMLGALAGMILTALPAYSSIVYTDIEDTTVSQLTDGLYFSLESGQAWVATNFLNDGDSTGANFSVVFNANVDTPFMKMHSESSTGRGTMINQLNNPAGSGVRPLDEGDLISSSVVVPNHINFSGGFNFGSALWQLGDRGYVGFKFLSVDATEVYGWADISVNLDKSVTLYRFAYDNTGAAINAGQIVAVPEPSSVVLSILTAGSLAALVRRRNSKLAA